MVTQDEQATLQQKYDEQAEMLRGAIRVAEEYREALFALCAQVEHIVVKMRGYRDSHHFIVHEWADEIDAALASQPGPATSQEPQL